MTISMELIDEMRKRTNCSYQEAKELLEKHQGDLVDAIIEFENKYGNKKKQGPTPKKNGFGKKVRELVQKGFVTRFIIEKDGNTILNIPMNILILAVLLTMPAFWLYLIGIVVIYFMGYKIRIRKEEGQEVDINVIVDEIGSKVKSATDKMRESSGEKASEQPQNPNTNQGKDETGTKDADKKEDGYSEITVE